MLTISELMHIDRTHQVTVSREPASPACPISSLGLVFMPTARTLATCSSFGASEARDVSLFGLVGEIVDIFPIFPQGHPLIVVSAIVMVTHAVRMADEERPHVLSLAEVDHLACGLVPQITYTPLCTSALLVFSVLQLLPAARILLATALLFGKLSQMSVALPFEGADPTSRNNHGSSGIRRDCGQMDFSQIDRCMNFPWSVFLLWGLDPDMQFKAVVPDQRTRSTVFREGKRQNQRSTPPTHRKDNTVLLTDNRLSRPGDGIEAFGTPGILHAHLRMFLPQDTSRLDVSKKGMHDHLHRLAVQGKPPFGGLLQFITPRPFGMGETGLLVRFHTHIPHLGRFHMEGLQAFELCVGQLIQLVDVYRLNV